MLNKFILLLFAFSISGFCAFVPWTPELVRAEFERSRAHFQQDSVKYGCVPLAMARWASLKARTEELEADQKKYASLACVILNQAMGFGWKNAAPTSKQIACMQTVAIDIALSTTDPVDNLFKWSPDVGLNAGDSHYNILQRAANAARIVGSKVPQLTPSGVISWLRLPGIRGDIMGAAEAINPLDIVGLFTPRDRLVSIYAGAGAYDWRAIGAVDTWNITPNATELLQLADGAVRSFSAWAASTPNVTGIRRVYNKLLENGGRSDAYLQAPYMPKPGQFSPPVFSKLIPLFALLDPSNFNLRTEQRGFEDEKLKIGNIQIDSPTAKWHRVKARAADFAREVTVASGLLAEMGPIIKRAGFGDQGVHALDAFRTKNTGYIFDCAKHYFAELYEVLPKKELIAQVKARMDQLTEISAAPLYDVGRYAGEYAIARTLTSKEIADNLGFVLNGYPTWFTSSIGYGDGVTENNWVEMLCMLFGVSQKIDEFRYSAGIDSSPFNKESWFYSQIYENQFTGGGCVPGRKNRILYNLVNLLRSWMEFGYQLA